MSNIDIQLKHWNAIWRLMPNSPGPTKITTIKEKLFVIWEVNGTRAVHLEISEDSCVVKYWRGRPVSESSSGGMSAPLPRYMSEVVNTLLQQLAN